MLLHGWGSRAEIRGSRQEQVHSQGQGQGSVVEVTDEGRFFLGGGRDERLGVVNLRIGSRVGVRSSSAVVYAHMLSCTCRCMDT